MIITIKGKEGEGKTLLAKEICKGKNVSFIEQHFLKSPFWTELIDDNVDFIIIDNVVDKSDVLDLFSLDEIQINRRMKNSYKIKTPNIILIECS
jgi:thymidylate kinase